MAILEVEHLSKSFDRTEVLKDITFSLEKGQVLSIIGSSGSGKTTLLRCLNFLERPDGGSISVNGETLFDIHDPITSQEGEIRKKRLHFGFTAGERQEGKKAMEVYFLRLKNQMAHFLENDEKIRQGIFTENLTAEIFTDYIFTLFLSILLEKQNEKESFLEFVKNYLY